MSKRPVCGGKTWAQKKKFCKESPVKSVVEFDFSHVKLGLNDWAILFRCCGVLLKDAPSGSYKILVVCCMDVLGNFFKLTAMGGKAEDYFKLLEVDKVFMLRNGVVVQKGAHDLDYSWMVGNVFDLKTDMHTVLTKSDDENKGSIPTMKYSFIGLEQLSMAHVNKIIDTYGYVADVGEMTTAILPHESFAVNMSVGCTLGCTTDARLLISGMGFRRGTWYEKSGISEDSIVALKGVRIEKKIEGTEDWLGHIFDDSCIRVNENLPEGNGILLLKQGGNGDENEENADEVQENISVEQSSVGTSGPCVGMLKEKVDEVQYDKSVQQSSAGASKPFIGGKHSDGCELDSDTENPKTD